MRRSCRVPLPLLVFAAALLALAPAAARAGIISGQPGSEASQQAAAGVSFSLDATAGLVEGTATEVAFYYPYGRKFKLSELTWDLKDIVMAGVNGSVSYSRLRLNLGVSKALNAGNGLMVDRDWNYSDVQSSSLKPTDRNWTDQSRHPDTSLDEGISLDLNLSVLALQAGSFSLRGLAGFRYDAWKWSARGGTYVYSTKYYGSRDLTGAFPAGEQVITYEQQYAIPYLGVGANWTRPAFQVESHLRFSKAVSARDSDEHLLRDVRFEGEFSGGTYLGLGLNATWAFAEHWAATLGVEYTKIPELTGDVSISGKEGSGFFGGGGGISMNATAVTVGAGYRF